MRKAVWVLVMVLVASMVGCSRDDEVRVAMAALDGFTQQLLKNVKSGASASDGLDAARTFFDSNQKDVSPKVKAILNLRGYQVSADTKSAMEGCFTKNITDVESLKIDLMMATMNDKALDEKLNRLITDYEHLVKGE